MKKLNPEFDEMRRHFPAGFESSMVLPCLRHIQEERGYIADSDIDELVECLGVARIQVEEVLSFYTHLHRKPLGRWRFSVLPQNVSCSMPGAETLLTHLQKRLGIKPGETTQDGRFTLGTVECLGSCERRRS